jgi:SAM-dependent methyltransferase
MQDTVQNEWFQVWFNSPYYHILYKDRDENEARRFIDALFDYLRPRPGAPALDLACGKGRYSRYLEEKGCDVTGLDISEESIAYARQFESERLHFFQHDMRAPFRSNYFDYIFNFFTSFGYFENERDHLGAIRHIAQGLKPEGRFVLDFFNAEKVVRELKAQEIKDIDQYTFTIRKEVDEQGYIVKTIAFEAGGQPMSFTERVRAFTLADFEDLFQKAGLRIVRMFGDYALNDYDPAQSDRLILVAEKIW